MNEILRRVDPCGDYEVLQRVGHGSYGEVYKARDLRTGEFAAVKMVKLETGDNFADIQQEILVLKDCRHKNIISYYGSYLKRDRLWIVMEYCAGGSLQDIYQMTGGLTELQIAFICRETLQGLSYLHRRGKVHRDVKGANILLTHTGDVKLADFGIAAQITATLGKRRSFIGTPYWMAPEVANVEHSGGYGSECDVWALGITSIELAELKPPYYDLQPMQVLYMMTKSSYKIPKLKDKKKWSPCFTNFVKCCLVKNPKKRPSPDKLLETHPFVFGSLSSLLTLNLLDRVNHPERNDQTQPQGPNNGGQQEGQQQRQNGHRYRVTESESDQESDTTSNHSSNIGALHNCSPRPQFIQPVIQFTEDNPKLERHHSSAGQSSSSSSSSKECLHKNEDNDGDDDEVFERNSQSDKQQSYHSERTLLASHSSQEEYKTLDAAAQGQPRRGEETEEEAAKEPAKGTGTTVKQRRPRNLRIPVSAGRHSRPISSVNEQKLGNRLLARLDQSFQRIDESFRQRWSRFRSKSTSMVNISLYAQQGANSTPVACPSYPTHHHTHQPFQSRPSMTCRFGMVPTPQVTMGACFVTVLHRSQIRVNCCAQWFHPANLKQFMVIGAEQGIFALDLTDMSGGGADGDAPLIQLHERRCTWLYVIQDTVTALQGKTPYLYRHDLIQLFQQELITQKLVSQLDKLPDRLKPKALISSIRMPETKDCFQCTVERSINDGLSVYLCCAVPNAVILFQWYDPLARFVWLKRIELDKLSLPYRGPLHLHRPFNLIFGSNASNSDYPLVCIGISRALTSPVGTAQQLLHELRNKPQKDKLELQFVDFNEPSGGARKLHELFASDLFGGTGSSDEEETAAADTRSFGSARSPAAGTRTSLRTIWRWREKLENVVALKQLDRDTLFIAYGNNCLITDLEGNEKKADLKVTQSFEFNFRLEYAIPLADSVLAFHKHGVQGKSFFCGTVTQELNDPSKQYELVGKDTLIVLKRRNPPSPPTIRFDDSPAAASPIETTNNSRAEEDICVLTGHVSTMTPP